MDLVIFELFFQSTRVQTGCSVYRQSFRHSELLHLSEVIWRATSLPVSPVVHYHYKHLHIWRHFSSSLSSWSLAILATQGWKKQNLQCSLMHCEIFKISWGLWAMKVVLEGDQSSDPLLYIIWIHIFLPLDKKTLPLNYFFLLVFLKETIKN